MKYYSIDETAKILGFKARTIRYWIRDGKLHAKKFERSNRWQVPETEIERKLNEIK